MKVFVPQSPSYPLVKLTASAGTWQSTSLCDHSHHEAEVEVPATIEDSEVTVVAEFCNGRGQPQLPGVTVKEGAPKAKPKPKAEAKPEVKQPEVKHEAEKPSEAKTEENKAEGKVEQVKPATGWNKLHS